MKRWIGLFLTAAVTGTLLHSLYDWFPNPLFGIIAPLNESVWEHLKLLFWPWIFSAFLWGQKQQGYWAGISMSLLAMPPVLLGIFYTLKAGFGIEAVWIDIANYYIVLAFGTWFAHHVRKLEEKTGLLVMLAALWGGILLIFSACPLNLPIFW